MAPLNLVHPDVLLLADLYRADWPTVCERIRLSGHPTNIDDPPADPPEDPPADPVDPPADPPKDPPADPVKASDDWKVKSRKHERDAKTQKDRADALEAKLAEIEKSKLSDQEKAIATAREEAKAEASATYEPQIRKDRLEAAVTRHAVVKGITLGEGDDAKTVKFADDDDVQMWLERQIAKGEIDGDDIYKDGKVDIEALTDALTMLATAKPGWLVGAAASNGAPAGKPTGDADAGKGGAAKGLEAMSVEDHYKRKSIANR